MKIKGLSINTCTQHSFMSRQASSRTTYTVDRAAGLDMVISSPRTKIEQQSLSLLVQIVLNRNNALTLINYIVIATNYIESAWW